MGIDQQCWHQNMVLHPHLAFSLCQLCTELLLRCCAACVSPVVGHGRLVKDLASKLDWITRIIPATCVKTCQNHGCCDTMWHILHTNSVSSQLCCHCKPLHLTSTTHHHPFNRKTYRKGGRRSGFVSKKLPLDFLPCISLSYSFSNFPIETYRKCHGPDIPTTRTAAPVSSAPIRRWGTHRQAPDLFFAVVQQLCDLPRENTTWKLWGKSWGLHPQSIWLIRIQTALNIFKSKH